MLWIRCRRNESIPQEMLYLDYQTDRDDRIGQTPLMFWIKYRPGEDIPQELFYDGWQTDKDYYG